MNDSFYVYKHTNLSNGKCYIGITSQIPERRWRQGQGYATQKVFNNAIKKYGWDGFKHEVLYQGLTQSEAESKERELIFLYNSFANANGYNLREGGKWTRVRRTTEQRQKYSERMREYNEKHPNEPWDDDFVIKKLAETHPYLEYLGGYKGSRSSERITVRCKDCGEIKKYKAKSLWNRRLHIVCKCNPLGSHPHALTEKAKDKIRKSKQKQVIGTDDQGNTIEFSSIMEAARCLGIDNSTIGHALHGRILTAGGYVWKFKEVT